jgi:hypothetical protein
LAEAWGVVDVKRVASVADRGIVTTSNILEAEGDASRTVDGGFMLHLHREIHQEIFLGFDDPAIFSVGVSA